MEESTVVWAGAICSRPVTRREVVRSPERVGSTPLCCLHSNAPSLDGIELMAKGGQMGDEDVFERLVHGTR